MKKVKIGLLKKYNAAISLLLSLLGFSTACNQGCAEYGAQVAEYGVPHANFIVKGNVRSEKTDLPISSIRVVMNYDTVITDENGTYQVENTDFPEDQTFLLEFKDGDGSVNGEYQSLDTIVEFMDPQFTGGDDSWDAGETESEVNVKMKPIE